jgi:tRNA/tmRNA/rRNA uracil-C5-methylase (TrmA/RlmC/RlmD family)
MRKPATILTSPSTSTASFGNDRRTSPQSSTQQQQQQQDELKCIHFSTCSGCSLQTGFTQAPTMQRARKFFAAHGLPNTLPIHIHYTGSNGNKQMSKGIANSPSSGSKIAGWRTHAKLAVQPMSKWGGIKIGLYRQGSHEVAETISSCQVHHPRINEALEIFRRVAIDTEMSAFTPLSATNKPSKSKMFANGAIRYIAMSVERSPPHRIALVIVLYAKDYKSVADLDKLSFFLKELKKKTRSMLGTGAGSASNTDTGDLSIWHSITLNFHPDPNSNTIYNFGRGGDEDSGCVDTSSWKHVWGLPFLKERIGNVTFFLRPQIFRQANLDGFESMILPMIDRYVPQNSNVAELYSGVGIIGLNLAYKVNRLLCSDSNPFIDDLFDKAAKTLPEVSFQSNEYIHHMLNC